MAVLSLNGQQHLQNLLAVLRKNTQTYLDKDIIQTEKSLEVK